MTRPVFRTILSAVAHSLIAASFLAVPSEAQTGAAVIARWSFDEGQGNQAGDGKDGATKGEIIKATWTKGRSGGALAFEDYSLKNYLRPDVKEATRVVIPHHSRLNITKPFTLQADIFPTRDPLYYGGIVEKGDGYGSTFRLLMIRGRKIRAVYGAGNSQITSSKPLALNAWHNLELIFDGSNLTLKVDGKIQASSANIKPQAASTSDVIIGERFSGQIDEVVLTAR
jgi:hypothetical protein